MVPSDRCRVSILVFVEVALGLANKSVLAESEYSFNPCFRGSRPRTHYYQSVHNSIHNVSILVFVEVALGHRLETNLSSHHYVSILVFVEVALGRCILAANLLDRSCFNPCFRGSRPRTRILRARIPEILKFQSLFSWKSPSDGPVSL